MDRSTGTTDTNYINPRVLKARPFTFVHYIFFTLLIIFALVLLFSYFYKVLVLSFKNKKRKKQNNGDIEDCADADVDLQISLTRIDGLTEENIFPTDQSRVLNSTDLDSGAESPKNRKESKLSKEEKSELNYYTAATLTFGRSHGHGSQDHLENLERPRVIAPYPLGNPNMPMPGFDVDGNDSHNSHEYSIEHIQEAWREIPSFINPASLSQLHDVLPPPYDAVVNSGSDPRADNVQR